MSLWTVRAGSLLGAWPLWPFLVLGLLLGLGGGLQASEAPSLSERVTTLSQSVSTLNELAEMLLQRLKQRGGEVATLQTNLQTLNAEAESLRRERESLTNDIASLSRDLGASRAESERLQRALAEISKLLNESDKKLQEALRLSRAYEQKLESRIVLLERRVVTWRLVGLAGIVATALAVTVALAVK